MHCWRKSVQKRLDIIQSVGHSISLFRARLSVKMDCLLFSRFGGNTPAEVTPSSHAGDLETLKQELLTEMRQELQKVKDEIIHGLNSKLLRFVA